MLAGSVVSRKRFHACAPAPGWRSQKEGPVLWSHARKLTVFALALLLSQAAAGPALAQTATPAVYPTAPDPNECVVESTPMEDIAAILGTPVAEPDDNATPFAPPAGQPADAETSA